jgi:UV DNA damage endonuclease
MPVVKTRAKTNRSTPNADPERERTTRKSRKPDFKPGRSSRSGPASNPESASVRSPLRMGFAVKVIGKPGLRSNDSRRWQQSPHLRVSLDYVRGIFGYLKSQKITMYRLSSDLAPYLTHPDMPQFRNQIAECAQELEELGGLARTQGLRLSFHPSQYIILNSPDPKLTALSIHDIVAQAEILDRMGMGPEAVVVVHVGGVYGDKAAARERWARTYNQLPHVARRRLVLENDDCSFGAADVLEIHRLTGVPLVFDHQHFWCCNPERLELRPTVEKFLRTWAAGVRPKLHFSSPRTELRQVKRKNRATKKRETVLVTPLLSGHADYNNPFEFIGMMRQLSGLEFDVMLEAKAKDLALLRLRADLVRCAPDIAERFGLDPGVAEPAPVELPTEALEG